MKPRFEKLDRAGNYIILNDPTHSDVNPRTAQIMAKPQWWYYVKCTCGHREYRSQQELIDRRRIRACNDCRQEIYRN